MFAGAFHKLLSRLAVFLLALLLPTALHAAFPLAETNNVPCRAESTLEADLAASLEALEWQCDEALAAPGLAAQRTVLRFDLGENAEAAPPRFFVTARSPFRTIHLAIEDADGTLRAVSHAYEDLRPAMTGGLVLAELPVVTGESRTLYAAIDSPTNPVTMSAAYLSAEDPGNQPSAHRLLLLLSFLCGMLVMPLVFTPAFVRALRSTFVVWHTLLAIALLMVIAVQSGLLLYFVDVSPRGLDMATAALTGITIAAAGMFAYSFIEEGKLHPAFRVLLVLAAIWSLGISVLHSQYPFAWRETHMRQYIIAYLPVLWIFVTVLVDALSRGSRAAKFQLVGWAPLIVVGAVLVVGQWYPVSLPIDLMTLFYAGCVIEVMAITLGVADRFLALKRQADDARNEAIKAGRMSESDALTGLNNRRFLDEHFEQLREEGFTSLAALDLDHFKSINDTYGHDVGDAVLRAVGKALNRVLDIDTIAIRVGGEEFALMMRGEAIRQRAEAYRQAIASAVADLVDIDRPVTASMGLIEATMADLPETDFATLYKRADGLLYKAKESGRNRLMVERIKAFGLPGTIPVQPAAA